MKSVIMKMKKASMTQKKQFGVVVSSFVTALILAGCNEKAATDTSPVAPQGTETSQEALNQQVVDNGFKQQDRDLQTANFRETQVQNARDFQIKTSQQQLDQQGRLQESADRVSQTRIQADSQEKTALTQGVMSGLGTVTEGYFKLSAAGKEAEAQDNRTKALAKSQDKKTETEAETAKLRMEAEERMAAASSFLESAKDQQEERSMAVREQMMDAKTKLRARFIAARAALNGQKLDPSQENYDEASQFSPIYEKLAQNPATKNQLQAMAGEMGREINALDFDLGSRGLGSSSKVVQSKVIGRRESYAAPQDIVDAFDRRVGVQDTGVPVDLTPSQTEVAQGPKPGVPGQGVPDSTPIVAPTTPPSAEPTNEQVFACFRDCSSDASGNKDKLTELYKAFNQFVSDKRAAHLNTNPDQQKALSEKATASAEAFRKLYASLSNVEGFKEEGSSFRNSSQLINDMYEKAAENADFREEVVKNGQSLQSLISHFGSKPELNKQYIDKYKKRNAAQVSAIENGQDNAAAFFADATQSLNQNSVSGAFNGGAAPSYEAANQNISPAFAGTFQSGTPENTQKYRGVDVIPAGNTADL